MDDQDGDLREALRQFAWEQLEAGIGPRELCYALSMVATELGMRVTDGSLMVLPIVLKGISDAVGSYAEEIDHQEEDADPFAELERPDGMTLH